MSATAAVKEFDPDWAAVVAVVLGVTAFAVAQGLTYPLISLALESHRVAPLWTGLNAASFSAGLATATLLIQPLTRLLTGDRLIVLALLGCSASLAAFALVFSVPVWFLARFCLGLCAGLVFILSEAWLHSACPDRIRGRVSGIYGAGMCLGFAAGPLAIPLFGAEHGFGFAVTAVYVAAVAFLSAFLARRARTRPHPVPAGALLGVVRRVPILVVMVVGFGFADIAAISTMPVYFVRTGHSAAFAALSVSAMALPTAIAQPVIGLMLDKLPRLLVATGSGVTAATAFLVLPFLTSEPVILADFAVIGAASFAIYTCAITLLGERLRGGILVAGTATFSLSYAVGSALGSTFSGGVMEVAGPAAAPVVTGLVLFAFTAIFPADRRWRG